MGKFSLGIGLLAIGLLFPAVTVAAGDVYMPDKSPAGNGYHAWPFKAHSDWRYQMLIKAKLLGGRPFEMTEVWIAPHGLGTGLWSAKQFQLRAAHTTRMSIARDFATNLGTTPTVLKSGPITIAWKDATWTSLGISTGFRYDGVRNLVLELRYKGGPGLRGFYLATDPVTRPIYAHSGITMNAYDAQQAIKTTTVVYGPKMRFTIRDTQLVPGGSGQVGTAVNLNLIAPGWPGDVYQVGTALGSGPTPIGSRKLGLSVDPLLALVVHNLAPSVFRNYAGRLDATGRGSASIHIPNNRSLIGVRLYTAFVVVRAGEPNGVGDLSNTVVLTIR